jgi:ADP-ribosylglycohydrolase
MADNFIKWKNDNYWTAHGEVFDIGNTTLVALREYEKTGDLSGKSTNNEFYCGNGSLMRILPLLPYIKNMKLNDKFEFIQTVSSITHGNIRTSIACFIYLMLAEEILNDNTGNKLIIYGKAMSRAERFLKNNKVTKEELKHFEKIFSFPHHIPKEDISNSGYVVDSLFLSFHCFMKYNRYEICVCYALSFGGDTDTNAALTGALCTLMGGIQEIPERWLNKLSKKNELIDLSNRWNESMRKNNKHYTNNLTLEIC